MNLNQEQPFTGAVTDLIKKYGLVQVNAKLRNFVSRGIGGSSFFRHHPGYYVNLFANSTNGYTGGPSIKIQISKLMGEIICSIEKKIEVSDKDNRKLLVRHFNHHPARGSITQETHVTFLDDDFDAMCGSVLETALSSMSALVRLHETK